ncbi:MAG: hypothetical protein ACYCU8_00650 [Ferrimicrobium acidiphilum]
MPNYRPGDDPSDNFLTRTDPYWGGIWTVPGAEAGITWHDKKTVIELSERGLFKPKASELRWDEDAAYEILASSNMRHLYLKTIAAAFMWRTLTQEQIGDIIGWTGLRSSTYHDPHTILVPWSAGILQWGHPTDFFRRLRVVRPAYSMPPRFLNSLTYRERLSVFGGSTTVMHGRTTKHNILNAEISLRVGERLGHLFPIILGEGAAFAKVLMPQAKNKSPSYSVGDAVWVRADGLRVIVETGDRADPIVEKIKRWAAVLADDARGSRSLYLLFVIPNAHKGADWMKDTRDKISAGIFSALALAGYDAKYIASRVGVIEWSEWFPGYHEINNDSFSPLRVWQLDNQRQWRSVSLTDPYSIECDVDPSDAKKSIGYAQHLYGVPHFLRKNPIDLTEDLLSLAQRVARSRMRSR